MTANMVPTARPVVTAWFYNWRMLKVLTQEATLLQEAVSLQEASLSQEAVLLQEAVSWEKLLRCRKLVLLHFNIVTL